MANKLSQSDLEIIINLAEYRILTVSQMAAVYPKSSRLLRSKLKKFVEMNLVDVDLAPYGGSKGRIARIYSVGQAGFKLLRSEKLLNADIAFDRIAAVLPRFRCHMLAVNDFRVQLAQTAQIIPELKTIFLSPNSPFIERIDDDRTIAHERFAVDGIEDKWVSYTPDGVFVMRDTKTGKTLLFFLEMDMATESITSGKGYKNNIRKKIVNYQLTYKLRRYKRYESIFNSGLKGFRLLLVTSRPGHLAKLSRILSQCPPSEFINITDLESLSKKGLWSPIWHKGGRLDLRPVSILGSKALKDPPAPRDIS